MINQGPRLSGNCPSQKKKQQETSTSTMDAGAEDRLNAGPYLAIEPSGDSSAIQ